MRRSDIVPFRRDPSIDPGIRDTLDREAQSRPASYDKVAVRVKLSAALAASPPRYRFLSGGLHLGGRYLSTILLTAAVIAATAGIVGAALEVRHHDSVVADARTTLVSAEPSSPRSTTVAVGADSSASASTVAPPDAPVGTGEPSSVDSAEVKEARPDSSKRAGASKPSSTDSDALAREIRILDRSRRALAAGDGRGALSALDAYEAQCAQGTMLPEARLLRVQALLALGRSQDARRIADANRALFQGAYRDQVDALLKKNAPNL